jgi:hypothetical protein
VAPVHLGGRIDEGLRVNRGGEGRKGSDEKA